MNWNPTDEAEALDKVVKAIQSPATLDRATERAISSLVSTTKYNTIARHIIATCVDVDRFTHYLMLAGFGPKPMAAQQPQPIETAPLEPILTWCDGDDEPEWLLEKPDDHTLDEWRAVLKKWGRTHWHCLPRPPGGSK